MSWFEEASKRRKWLVGVSGGVDSVVLLHLLLEKGFRKLVVCHLDHRLRGRVSTADARFVEKLAQNLGLEVEIGRERVAERMRERRLSLETAAREARSDFFRECAKKFRCKRLILAHHAEDQAETVLWNLLRGSYGLRGMKMIKEVGSLEIHRPLLDWRRERVQAYASIKRLKWREDVTNIEPIAIRNRLRNEVFPQLSDVSQRDSIAAFVQAQGDWEELESLLDWMCKKAEVFDNQKRIHLVTLLDFPAVVQREILRRYLSERSISVNRDLLNRMMALLDRNNKAVVNLPGGRRFRRREGRLFVE